MAYEWTKRKFWGSPNLSYFIYKILTIFGFTGLDHMYLRSPGTGLLKLIVSFMMMSSITSLAIGGGDISSIIRGVAYVLIFSFWWIYDMISAWAEEGLVKKYGVKVPLFKNGGIGAGMFMEENAPPLSKDFTSTSFTFIIFVLLSFIPFAINNVFVGADKSILKLIISFFAGIFYMIQSLFVIFFKTETLFTEGVPGWKFDRVPSKLSIKGGGGSSDIISKILGGFRILEALPVVGPAIGMGITSIEKVRSVVNNTIDTAKATAETASKVSTMATTLPASAARSVDLIEEGIKAKLPPAPHPDFPGPISQPQTFQRPSQHSHVDYYKMHGGGSVATDTGMSGTILMTVICGGLLLAIGNFMHKQYQKIKEDRKDLDAFKSGSAEERSDVPPEAKE
jgi:hypothetical protein